jgi:fumarate reductase flavoprotein subunit
VIHRSLRRPAIWVAGILAAAVLAGCQSGAVSTPTPGLTNAAGPTPTYQVYAAATPTPKTVEAMKSILERDPSLMASQHSALGLKCQSCHIPFPPKGAPSNETCLSCHGGSYAVVAALTPGNMNPHKSHIGEIPCVFCHAGHEQSVSQCTQCKHKKT